MDFWIEFVLHLWKYVFTITWWVYYTCDLSQSIFILKIFVVEDIFIWPIHRVFHVYHCSFYLVSCHVVLPLMLSTLLSTIVISTTYVFFHAWLLPFLFNYMFFFCVVKTWMQHLGSNLSCVDALFNYMLTSFWLEHKPVFDKNICLFTRISRLLDKYNIKLVSESDKTNCFDSELFGLVFLWKIC